MMGLQRKGHRERSMLGLPDVLVLSCRSYDGGLISTPGMEVLDKSLWSLILRNRQLHMDTWRFAVEVPPSCSQTRIHLHQQQ